MRDIERRRETNRRWYATHREEHKENVRRRRADPTYLAKEYTQQAEYRNTEEYRARKRDEYHNLSGYEYNRLMLKRRRTKALQRRAARHKGD